MIDQSTINIFNHIPGQFKKIGNTGGGEYHGPCPFCGGRDRFAVWPNGDNGGRWWCRHCNRGGDALAFIMEYQALDFNAACEVLRLDVPEQPGQKTPRAPQPEVWASDLKDAPCFEKEWQWKAETFADACAAALWYAWEGSAGNYLESRGITKQMAVVANLGLNRADYHDTWGSVEVFLPRGITIPWEIEQQLYNVRVRRRNADLAARPDLAKYASPKGCANGMYGIGQLCPGDTVYVTEGEFDALVLRRYLREHDAQGRDGGQHRIEYRRARRALGDAAGAGLKSHSGLRQRLCRGVGGELLARRAAKESRMAPTVAEGHHRNVAARANCRCGLARGV